MGKQRINSREAILKGASELFSERGFHGVRTKEIAQRAGISEVTLFNHFSGKKELYTQIIEKMMTQKNETLGSVLNHLPKDDFDSGIRLIGEAILSDLLESRQFIKMAMKESDDVFPHYMVEERLLFISRHLEAFFVLFEGELTLSVSDAARLFMESLGGLNMKSTFSQDGDGRFLDMGRQFVTLFMRGIKKK